jgi:D-alanyl-D-alanine carboxypeptidase
VVRHVCVAVSVVLFALVGQARAFETVSWSPSSHEVVQSPDLRGRATVRPPLVPAAAGHTKPRLISAAAPRSEEGQRPSPRSSTPNLRHAVGVTGLAKAPRRPVPIPPTAKISGVRLDKVPATNHPMSSPKVQAKAACCLDCGSNKLLLAKNISEPLPIASITKLLTAMTVIDAMKLDVVITVPEDVLDVPPHKVGLRPGDRLTVEDLLSGLLMESGNDCAEVLALAYPRGGRNGFMTAMNQKAAALGASTTVLYTPSGLDMKLTLGRKAGRTFEATKANVASAKDVAIIAQAAFKYPLISRITSTKTRVITTQNLVQRTYHLNSTIKLLNGNLPVAGAKTGFTNMAGRCIVALFKEHGHEHMVVVLNSQKHFKAAEKIYRWASQKL